jgi:hypothetical protein
MSTKDGERSMSAKDVALAGCNDGFQDRVQKITDVLLGDWSTATTPAQQEQFAQRYRNSLELYKAAYEHAQQVITTVFP